MSLNQPIAQCPLLLQSDLIRLHPTLQITSIAVVDAALGATHQALPTAVPLLKLLKKGTTYRELLLVAHRSGCSTAQLRELLGFLQISGGIERYRQLHTWPEAIVHTARSACVGIREPLLTHRYQDSSLGLLRAILSAIRPLYIMSIVAVLLLSQLLQWRLGFSTSVCIYSLALFTGSFYLHEASHLGMLRKYKAAAIIVRQGLRIGILHRKLPDRQELRVSIAGPIFGALLCLLLAAISLHMSEQLLTRISLLIGLLHLSSLLPWYGDGRSVHSVLLHRKTYV